MNLRKAAQQALDALDRVMSHGPAVQEAKEILRIGLAEPQTTHWQGCAEVHSECRKKPLTDEEIGKIAGDTLDPWSCARAIEKAHGIGDSYIS